MDGLTFGILIIIILTIIGLIYAVYYNSFQKYLVKINEVEGMIDTSLRERFDLLNKASDFIKENAKQEVMKELGEIKSDELTSFELERKLVALTREFYEARLSNRNLVKKDNFINLDFAIKENEAIVDGYTSYYNDCISKYNKLVRMFPSNMIAKICKFEERTYYDGKNLNDRKVDDFKL